MFCHVQKGGRSCGGDAGSRSRSCIRMALRAHRLTFRWNLRGEQYDEWGVTLQAGDILVFHSDGIAETTNSDGQFFGTTRLLRFIEQHHEMTARKCRPILQKWTVTQGARFRRPHAGHRQE